MGREIADAEINARSPRGNKLEGGVEGPRLRESKDFEDIKDTAETGGSLSSRQSGKVADLETGEGSDLFVFGERELSRAERPGHVPPPQEPGLWPDEPSVRPSLVPRGMLRYPVPDAGEAPRTATWEAVGEPEEVPEPTIEITIGRIEVKSPPPPAPPARPARQGPRVSLNEYLRRRREGR